MLMSMRAPMGVVRLATIKKQDWTQLFAALFAMLLG
tara:strand:+ start:4803 stop:4910 length:108 start_codon:yes stop_codon:yes gene_type:complete